MSDEYKKIEIDTELMSEDVQLVINALVNEGSLKERERIVAWIEENRSAIEIEPGEYIYRDHFNSQSLIAFIKGETK
jgi:hypothetical protein